MATQQLTLELPEKIFHQFARIAKMTHQSIESLVIQSISSNLPPNSRKCTFGNASGFTSDANIFN